MLHAIWRFHITDMYFTFVLCTQTLIVNDCINPLLSMLTSTTVSFAGGALSRSLLCHKLVDLMYVLGLRLGLELTRQYLHRPMLVLMEAFTVVHGPEDGSCALSSSPGGIYLCSWACRFLYSACLLAVSCSYIFFLILSLFMLCCIFIFMQAFDGQYLKGTTISYKWK